MNVTFMIVSGILIIGVLSIGMVKKLSTKTILILVSNLEMKEVGLQK